MKRLFSFLTTSFALLTLVSLPATARAQGCSSVVTADEAGVITRPSVIEKAAISLLDQGADAHILTIKRTADYGSSLAAAEAAYESKCPDWKAPGSNARKPNLIVFVVAPADHTKNVFFGSQYARALKSPDA